MIFLGIIHCQILEGKYAEAKQQIEFQNEVQTGNAAVSKGFSIGSSEEKIWINTGVLLRLQHQLLLSLCFVT